MGAQGRKIVQRVFHVVFDDAVGALHPDAARAHGRCLAGRVDTGGDLEGAVRLGTVADHTGHVAHHVLDGTADLMVAAAQQVGDAAGGTGAGHGRAAEVAQAAKLGFDPDGDEIGEGDGPQHLFFVDVQPAGRCHNRHGGRNALVAAAGVCHHRDRGTRHPGVRARRGDDHGIGGQVAGHQALAAVQLQVAANGQAVLLGEALLADGGVHFDGAADDVDGVMQRVKLLRAVIPDGLHGQESGDLFRRHQVASVRRLGRGVRLVQRGLAVLLDQHHIGVQVPDHGTAGVSLALDRHVHIELLGHLCHFHFDLACFDESCRLLYLLRGHIVHDLQQVDRVTAHRADGSRVIHALVGSARDARRHRVFDDVDAGAHQHLFHRVGSRPTQCAPRLGGGQCHGTGLRTSGSKLHLAVQDPNEHVLFHIRFIFLFFRLRFVQSDSVSSSYVPGIPEQKSFSAHDPSFPELAGHFIPYCFLLCMLMGRLLLPC